MFIKQLDARGKGDGAAKHHPSQAVANIDLYPGLEATLFASEPMMLSPTNLDIDHRGRVWVCEVVNYREHAEMNRRPEGDRILILEDWDGNGEADTVKVYYQGRDIDAALGICVLGNKVIVTAAPNVIVFTDDNGDDKPDRKEYLFRNAGLPQNDHSTHSFLFGPDGKLYWNMGNGGLFVHDKDSNLVIDQAGKPVLARGAERYYPEFEGHKSVYQGGMVFRCNLDGSEFEVLGHNFRNNYEVTADSYGTLWQSDNDDDGNYGCRLNYVMEFGNFGYLDEITGAGWSEPRTGWHEEIPKRHWHQNDPGVVPNLVQTGAGSPAGITVYEGRLLPEVFWDKVLHCDPGPGVVWSLQATKQGAGYRGHLENLLQGERDRSVRPVDVAVAPDGSVFVTDWYDPVIGWNRQEDLERGRLFRIAPEDQRYHIPEFNFDSPEPAVQALQNPCHAVRYLAWTALNEMQTEAEPALGKLFESENSRHRARALWLLTKIEGRRDHYITAAVKDRDEDIRIVGLRVARQLKMDIIPLVRSLSNDPSPQVRRECAIALRHNKSPEAPALWAKLAEQHDGKDRWYLEALGIGAHEQWDAFLGAWLEKVGDGWSTPAGRDILWRSRARVTPILLARIINSPDVDLEGTKRYLRALDFQEECTEKGRVLRRLVLKSPGEGTAKHTFVASEALLRIDDFDISVNRRVRRAISRLMKRAEGTTQFAQLVQRYRLSEHYPGLMNVAAANKDSPTGIAAIQTLQEAEEYDLIRNFLSGSNIDRATNTAEVLGNSRDRRAVPLLVQAVLNEELDRRVREEAARALSRTGAGIKKLVDLAERGDFPTDLARVAGAAISSSMHVELREQAAKLFPFPPLKNNEPLPQMTELLVYVGNSDRGRKVFKTAGCNQCHVIQGRGTNFGPDLSQIGHKLSKWGLYESILDPDAGVSPTYQLNLLQLHNGEEISGFIISETNEKLTVRSAGGVVADFSRTDVLARNELPGSAMPSNLQLTMTVDEMVDLVEYLTTLK